MEDFMPIYEYLCQECGTRFETIRSMREADLPIDCQDCGSAHTERLISVFNAQSGGRVVAGGSSGCAGCSGGACSSCGH